MTTQVAVDDLMNEALSRIHDYVDPMGVSKRADALKAKNQTTYAAMRSVNADFEHLVQFSDDYDEILQAALAAVDSERMFKAADKIRSELDRHNENARVFGAEYGSSATKPALDFLNAQLHDVMRTVRDQEAALKGITDARGANRGGGASQDAWMELEVQLERYKAIRQAQRAITVRLSAETINGGSRQWRTHVLGRSGFLADAFDFEDFWQRNRVMSYATGGRGIERGEGAFIAWAQKAPTPRHPRDTQNDLPADEIEYLRWISDGDKAWVPDLDQLMRVHDLAEQMLNAALPLKTRTAARDEYYDQRGLTPAEGRESFQDERGQIRGGSFE